MTVFEHITFHKYSDDPVENKKIWKQWISYFLTNFTNSLLEDNTIDITDVQKYLDGNNLTPLSLVKVQKERNSQKK